MSNLEFFKKEAKNLLKDWKTQKKSLGNDESISFHYDWKFYNVSSLFSYYDFNNDDEQDIILARAQHLIAKMVGFKKWDDLIHSSEIKKYEAEVLLRRFKVTQDIQLLKKKPADDFQKMSEPKNYLRFLEQTFPDKDTRRTFEFFLASILAHDNKPRKAAFFIGDGNTGKSAMCHIIHTVFNGMTTSFIVLGGSLGMVNWDDSYLTESAVIGNHIEYKISGKLFEIFTTNPVKNGKFCMARMIIQGNFMPRITGDKSHYDSVLVIPFEHKIERDNQIGIEEMCDKLKTEVPAIMMRYKKLYIELRDRFNGEIPESKLSKSRKRQYIEQANLRTRFPN